VLRPDGFQRLDAEGRRSSNGWNVLTVYVPTVGSVACPPDPTAAVPAPKRAALCFGARVGGTISLAAVLSAHLAPPRCARRGTTPGPAWSAKSTAPRRAASAGSAPSFHSVTLPASTRTTFRCVTGEPTRFPSSRLRRSPDPRCRRPPPGYVMPRACPRRLGQPRVTPSPPALSSSSKSGPEARLRIVWPQATSLCPP